MALWETPDVIPGRTPGMLEFARIWQAADKIVYSKSLERLYTEDASRAGIRPAGGSRPLNAQLPHDVSVAGPTLAAHAIRTGLVDEYRLLVVPTRLGGGTLVLPNNVRIRLDLLESAVLPMEWSISATKRKPDGGCRRRF
jgi:riboflavin biosynthesis pyrimidine reductase